MIQCQIFFKGDFQQNQPGQNNDDIKELEQQFNFQADQFGEFLSVYSDHQNLTAWIDSLKITFRNLYDSE